MKTYFVYIMANKSHSTIYVGFTNNLERRVYEHKQKLTEGFTSRYNINSLLYYEQHHDVHEAILREKQIKKWKTGWKSDLINSLNPEWRDLSEGWYE